MIFFLCRLLPINTPMGKIYFRWTLVIKWNSMRKLCRCMYWWCESNDESQFGVIAKINAKNRNCCSSYCILRRDALDSRITLPEIIVLNATLKNNYTKFKPFKNRLFTLMYNVGRKPSSVILSAHWIKVVISRKRVYMFNRSACKHSRIITRIWQFSMLKTGCTNWRVWPTCFKKSTKWVHRW